MWIWGEQKHSFQCCSEKSFGISPNVSHIVFSISILRIISTRVVTLTCAEIPTVRAACYPRSPVSYRSQGAQVQALSWGSPPCRWELVLLKDFMKRISLNSFIPLLGNPDTEAEPPCLPGTGSYVSPWKGREAGCLPLCGVASLLTRLSHPVLSPLLVRQTSFLMLFEIMTILVVLVSICLPTNISYIPPTCCVLGSRGARERAIRAHRARYQ